MQSETRQCQNCKKDFVIEPEDFNFYEKIKVPPPTFCPECRLERRLVWMPSMALFKRSCDLCGRNVLSMYEQDSPFKVYCHECWWSDKWDPLSFGIDVDFSRPFFEQWRELFQKTPILGLAIDTTTGKLSPYTNHCSYAKHCYMIYYCDKDEECLFGYQLTNSKECIDSSTVLNSTSIFDSSNVFKCFNLVGSISNNRSCYDSSFLRDCEGAHNCFGTVNVKNGSNIFFGKKFSKGEYNEKIKNINLGSYKQYIFWKNKALDYFKQNIPQPVWETQSYNSTGSYVFNSKNCKECYDVTGCEDSKYLMLIKEGQVKDCYDYTDWGNNVSLVYDSVVVGESAASVKFSQHCSTNIKNIEYCKLQLGGSDCFGCVSARKKEYCILNKQYSKEEYSKLREKIIKHMDEIPYVDKKGNVYKYGEFFPMEFSPHAYNNSLANFYFPKTKNEVMGNGLTWHEENLKEYPITVLASNLPDDVKDTKDEITKEVIGCSSCPRGYKIIKQELDLAKKLNVPLSRQCPFCRIEERVNRWVSQMKLVERVCDKCGDYFMTHYSKEKAPKIFCKKCYQQEVY